MMAQAKDLEGLNYLLFFPDKNDENMLESLHTDLLNRTPLGQVLREIAQLSKDAVEADTLPMTSLTPYKLITGLRQRSDKIDKLLKNPEFLQ